MPHREPGSKRGFVPGKTCTAFGPHPLGDTFQRVLLGYYPHARGWVGRRVIDDLEGARVLAACWNAWVDERELWKEPVIENSLEPISIRYTGWEREIDLLGS